MIRRTLRAPRYQVDLHLSASCRHWSRDHNVVDPPAPVVAKRTAEVVPVGIRHGIGMQHAERVGEAPGSRLFERLASIDVEVGIIYATVGVVYVDRLRSDVQI